MQNLKLPRKDVDRVMQFHKLKWRKYRGLDENQILSDLPKTLKEKILEYLLKEMIEKSDLFPKNEVGF